VLFLKISHNFSGVSYIFLIGPTYRIPFGDYVNAKVFLTYGFGISSSGQVNLKAL
jgi:hypothetical protein